LKDLPGKRIHHIGEAKRAFEMRGFDSKPLLNLYFLYFLAFNFPKLNTHRSARPRPGRLLFVKSSF
jgi:hypothetical protein